MPDLVLHDLADRELARARRRGSDPDAARGPAAGNLVDGGGTDHRLVGAHRRLEVDDEGVLDNRIDVVFKESNGFNVASLNDQRRLIQDIILEMVGKRVLLHCISGALPAPTEPEPEAQAEPPIPDELESALADADAEEKLVDMEPVKQVAAVDFSVADKLVESLDGELIRS